MRLLLLLHLLLLFCLLLCREPQDLVQGALQETLQAVVKTLIHFLGHNPHDLGLNNNKKGQIFSWTIWIPRERGWIAEPVPLGPVQTERRVLAGVLA